MAAVAPATSQWHAEETTRSKGEPRFSLSDDDEGEENEGDDDDNDDDDDGGSQKGDFFLPIQQHSRPATPADVVFERDVLALPGGKTENELNRHYTLAAQDLGLEESQSKRLDSQEHAQQNHQHLDVPDSTLTVASSLRDSLSRTSQSTLPTSCDSSEMQSQTYRPRPSAAPSIMTTNKSVNGRPASILSTKSISSSIRNGFRRLSILSKRGSPKVSGLPFAESSPAIQTSAPSISSRSQRPSTSQSTVVASSLAPGTSCSRGASVLSNYNDDAPGTTGSPESSTTTRHRPLSRGQSLPSIKSVSTSTRRTTTNFSTPFSPTRAKSIDPRALNSRRALPPTKEEGFSSENEKSAAQARTSRNRDLQRMRSGQLQEQRRFLSFQREQYEKLRIRHSDRLRAHRKLWRQKERELGEQHHGKETELEQRQLNAEFEMMRTMESEKKSVDARLRHMEGYVKGRGIYDTSTIGKAVSTEDANSSDGSFTTLPEIPESSYRDSGLHLTTSQFPARVVSSHSMAMLNQQYRVRSQLPQLHSARINVLREQQGKLLSRLQARHAVEVNALQQEQEDAATGIALQNREDEDELRRDFSQRRDRMEWRWKVAESMELKRLEEERGVSFAELRPIDWSVEAWKGVS